MKKCLFAVFMTVALFAATRGTSSAAATPTAGSAVSAVADGPTDDSINCTYICPATDLEYGTAAMCRTACGGPCYRECF